MWNSVALATDRSAAKGRVNNELYNVATQRDGCGSVCGSACDGKGHAQNGN